MQGIYPKKTFLQLTFSRAFSAGAVNPKQLNLMLFGAPGVGKGTYSKLMEKEYDFKTFSMGDYFR
jgi:adenylate kinase